MTFQSERAGCRVTFYTHGDDPVFQQPRRGKIETRGENAENSDLTVIGATTSKNIGIASGDWRVRLKVPDRPSFNLRRLLRDDDWVDITFMRYGRQHHTMRGLIDGMGRVGTVTEHGATASVWEIYGRDHGKIYEDTKIWFNNYSGENIMGGAILRQKSVEGALYGSRSPTAVVNGILFGWLRALGGVGRALWELPNGMPGVARGTRFAEQVQFTSTGDSDLPARVAVNINLVDGIEGTSIWPVAQEWSDPTYNELFVDLVERSTGAPLNPGTEYRPEDTRMGVVMRARPFVDRVRNIKSPWFGLPTAEIARQDIADGVDLGEGGAERVNLVTFAPSYLQEFVGNYPDIAAPFVDEASMLRHGVQRLDIRTPYQPKMRDVVTQVGLPGVPAETFNELASAELLSPTEWARTQRQKVADWHVLNPYFLSGTIPLTHGRPDIHIGHRLKVRGDQGPREDITYYVETVTHSFQTGGDPASPHTLRSTLGVVRGWEGPGASLLEAVNKQGGAFRESARYKGAYEDTPLSQLGNGADFENTA